MGYRFDNLRLEKGMYNEAGIDAKIGRASCRERV